mgnify:CR=1 FL=1|jgi:hypothetical protein
MDKKDIIIKLTEPINNPDKEAKIKLNIKTGITGGFECYGFKLNIEDKNNPKISHTLPKGPSVNVEVIYSEIEIIMRKNTLYNILTLSFKETPIDYNKIIYLYLDFSEYKEEILKFIESKIENKNELTNKNILKKLDLYLFLNDDIIQNNSTSQFSSESPGTNNLETITNYISNILFGEEKLTNLLKIKAYVYLKDENPIEATKTKKKHWFFKGGKKNRKTRKRKAKNSRKNNKKK